MNDSTTTARPLLAALAAVLLLSWLAAPAGAREWESQEHNCRLVVPDAPAPWAWLPEGRDWDDYGIVKGATRVLEKLKSGDETDGEHALVHLIVRKAEEGATPKGLSEDEDVREMLLARFGSSSDWPALDVRETVLNDDLPAVLMMAEGKALNARTGEHDQCDARMLVTVARGRAYFLRMYAWTTEYDDEGLSIDLDMIEGEFTILNTKPIEERPEKPEGNGEGGAPMPEDEDEKAEEREPEDIDFREQLLRLTKHGKLDRLEPNTEGMLLRLEGNDGHGYYGLYLYATSNSRVIDGVQAPPLDIKKWITKDWWKNFLPNHPDGEIYTVDDWPRRQRGLYTFLTVPDLSEDNLDHIAGGDKDTPVEPSSSDMLKRMKCVEKVKRNYIGRRQKVIEPYRGVLVGSRPRQGRETILRFAWRTPAYSFRLFVMLGGEGEKFVEPLRETLHSIEHYED